MVITCRRGMGGGQSMGCWQAVFLRDASTSLLQLCPWQGRKVAWLVQGSSKCQRHAGLGAARCRSGLWAADVLRCNCNAAQACFCAAAA
jgi:hypothetical protein